MLKTVRIVAIIWYNIVCVCMRACTHVRGMMKLCEMYLVL